VQFGSIDYSWGLEAVDVSSVSSTPIGSPTAVWKKLQLGTDVGCTIDPSRYVDIQRSDTKGVREMIAIEAGQIVVVHVETVISQLGNSIIHAILAMCINSNGYLLSQGAELGQPRSRADYSRC